MEKIVQEPGLTDWHVTFNCSTAKKGYSGTATLCRWDTAAAEAIAVQITGVLATWWTTAGDA